MLHSKRNQMETTLPGETTRKTKSRTNRTQNLLREQSMSTKTMFCAWELPTEIGTVKFTRKNSSREQIVETIAARDRILPHAPRYGENRSQANKTEDKWNPNSPLEHKLRSNRGASTTATNSRWRNWPKNIGLTESKFQVRQRRQKPRRGPHGATGETKSRRVEIVGSGRERNQGDDTAAGPKPRNRNRAADSKQKKANQVNAMKRKLSAVRANRAAHRRRWISNSRTGSSKIQIEALSGKTHTRAEPDRNGRRSLGDFGTAQEQ
jgi:hypothetical protein